MIWSLQLSFTLKHTATILKSDEVDFLWSPLPERQMVWLPSAEVRQKLDELDQTELEVSRTDNLLLLLPSL